MNDRSIVRQPQDKHGEAMVYLVMKTKSEKELEKLRLGEAPRIWCGERHFREALQVCYAVVRWVDEIP